MTEDILIQRRERMQRVINLDTHKDANYRRRFQQTLDKMLDKWEQSYIESKDGLITCVPETEKIVTRL